MSQLFSQGILIYGVPISDLICRSTPCLISIPSVFHFRRCRRQVRPHAASKAAGHALKGYRQDATVPFFQLHSKFWWPRLPSSTNTILVMPGRAKVACQAGDLAVAARCRHSPQSVSRPSYFSQRNAIGLQLLEEQLTPSGWLPGHLPRTPPPPMGLSGPWLTLFSLERTKRLASDTYRLDPVFQLLITLPDNALVVAQPEVSILITVRWILLTADGASDLRWHKTQFIQVCNVGTHCARSLLLDRWSGRSHP